MGESPESSILTLTVNPTIDTSAKTEHVVDERKLRCRDARFDPGGGGLNVARSIARLGGKAFALYTAGGAVGTMLQELLDQEDIQHEAIPISGWTRQSFIVFEEANERQYRFGLPGPSLAEKEWQAVLDELSSRQGDLQFVVASGSLPPGVPSDFYARVAGATKEKKARLILDTSGDALVQALNEGVYLVKPNLRELCEVLGPGIDTEEQQESALAELVESGKAEAAVLSLGGSGALFKSSAAAGRLRAPSVRRQSAVGAGDSMVAGIVLALSRGAALPEAALFGVAAGSAAVMSPGTELCRREDTERLFARMNKQA